MRLAAPIQHLTGFGPKTVERSLHVKATHNATGSLRSNPNDVALQWARGGQSTYGRCRRHARLSQQARAASTFQTGTRARGARVVEDQDHRKLLNS
ncbi:hypothetical protein PCAR4_350054 [Paraburkholderia caribensis]|nr:hypothetical protein PCAR4_350054 [Paraburkholderia caribensis]